ncbi:MAG: energy-coupling factor transporter transmembrane component T [Chloroflexota bacterium]
MAEFALYKEVKGIILDPRTKLLLLILANFLLFSFGNSLYLYAAAALGALLLLLARAYTALNVMVGTYAVLYGLDYLIRIGAPSAIPAWSALALPFFIFLPVFMFAALFFATTSISDAAAAFQKMKVPKVVLIPLLVMFRFIPTLSQEFRAITNAMRLRGAVGRGNPLKTIEYVYVPLLFNLVKTGEELTLASLTRGLGLHNDRTLINDPVLKWFDYLSIVFMILLIVGRRWGPI